jgi:hypothetical protein
MLSMVMVSVITLIMLFYGNFGFAADMAARQKYGSSPHRAGGDCTVCHVYPAEKLRGWFVLGSTKREMKANPVELCAKCHGLGFGHAVGKKTPINHSGLPLDSRGEITCATTCHDMHVITEDQKQNFYHLRMPFDSLCISCHDS